VTFLAYSVAFHQTVPVDYLQHTRLNFHFFFVFTKYQTLKTRISFLFCSADVDSADCKSAISQTSRNIEREKFFHRNIGDGADAFPAVFLDSVHCESVVSPTPLNKTMTLKSYCYLLKGHFKEPLTYHKPRDRYKILKAKHFPNSSLKMNQPCFETGDLLYVSF
jgi:hypothetical protein